MKECVDIYSRILVTTITFVVPIIINLLATFGEGAKRRITLASQSEEEVNKRASMELANESASFKETIQKTNAEFKKIETEMNKELQKLNPIRQFWIIFSFISSSCAFLILFHLFNSNYIYNMFNLADKFSLLISGFLYGIALFFIIRILYTITQTKKLSSEN